MVVTSRTGQGEFGTGNALPNKASLPRLGEPGRDEANRWGNLPRVQTPSSASIQTPPLCSRGSGCVPGIARTSSWLWHSFEARVSYVLPRAASIACCSPAEPVVHRLSRRRNCGQAPPCFTTTLQCLDRNTACVPSTLEMSKPATTTEVPRCCCASSHASVTLQTRSTSFRQTLTCSLYGVLTKHVPYLPYMMLLLDPSGRSSRDLSINVVVRRSPMQNG